MKLEDINTQVKKKPLTKEESKEQFIKLTSELDIKHSFNFEEAWEIGEEIRKRKDFREKITDLEKEGFDKQIWDSKEDSDKLNPVKHSFADGCYIREIFNPAGELIVTAIHKKEHPFFLMQGEMSILTEDGIKHLKAPHHGITKPGTKRIIYTHTDCIFITVHATEETDVAKIEEQVIAKDFQDPLITQEDMKLLTKIDKT
tara:strand:- start:1232 stop:1834 length:603 start_codon:yes stop_codon:yes gene_type:complete